MTIQAWAARHGCKVSDAMDLQYNSDIYKQQKENALNGKSHLSSKNNADKAENAMFWDLDAYSTKIKIKEIAERCGFNRVDFSDLYPSFSKDGIQWVSLP